MLASAKQRTRLILKSYNSAHGGLQYNWDPAYRAESFYDLQNEVFTKRRKSLWNPLAVQRNSSVLTKIRGASVNGLSVFRHHLCKKMVETTSWKFISRKVDLLSLTSRKLWGQFAGLDAWQLLCLRMHSPPAGMTESSVHWIDNESLKEKNRPANSLILLPNAGTTPCLSIRLCLASLYLSLNFL